MYFDPLYLIAMVPGLLLSLWASARTKSTFNRYSKVPAASGLTGAQAASQLLERSGVHGVRVEPVDGFLSDHYDPSKKVLRLSPDVYRGHSLAALGVAAHEAGHALQDAQGYAPLKFRSLVVQPAMIGSNLGLYIVMAGLLFQASSLVWLGIALFSAFVVFTMITLPVEFNASSRAIAALKSSGIVSPQESRGAEAVLNAAALTYVASALSAVLTLLYFLYRAGLLGGRDD
jgi:Zn-dependent membrane protease YugP